MTSRPSALRSRGRMVPALLLLLLTTACASAPKPSPIPGAYRFDDGHLMAISHSAENSFRYRDLESGDTGRLNPTGGLAYRSAEDEEPPLDVRFHQEGTRVTGLAWKPKDGAEGKAVRLPLREEEIRFRNGDVELYGKLVLPAEGDGPFPLVVLVHGSESSAATFFNHRQYQFPATGVAAFVYDKRGTGKSTGKFTMQFPVLAGDVVAAVERLRIHPKIDGERIGLAGYSQGGWVAPLAASKSPHVKFVLVGYGMLEPPSQEDRLEIHHALREKGFGDEEIRKADEVIDAAYGVMKSDMKEGWEEAGAVKRKYKNEPWAPLLRDRISGGFLRYPHWILRTSYARSEMRIVSWFHESLPVLEKLDIPMFWVLGGKDLEAPNEVTIAELERLRSSGKPFETKIFPDADHGILEFEEK
ncbi:MAG TPA: alpha/beta fold hydrolase, partial [Rubrobacter sp.]|nr:alpha/beta fold hydrolase [Rubrobacter sp.]